jgi:hypothetical protein
MSDMTLYPLLEFLAWTECHYATRSDRDFLTRFRVTTRALAFIAQLKIAKARQLNGMAIDQRLPNFFEKLLDQLFGFAFV